MKWDVTIAAGTHSVGVGDTNTFSSLVVTYHCFVSGCSRLHVTCQISSCICCWRSGTTLPTPGCHQKHMFKFRKKHHGLVLHSYRKGTLISQITVRGLLDPSTTTPICLIGTFQLLVLRCYWQHFKLMLSSDISYRHYSCRLTDQHHTIAPWKVVFGCVTNWRHWAAYYSAVKGGLTPNHWQSRSIQPLLNKTRLTIIQGQNHQYRYQYNTFYF